MSGPVSENGLARSENFARWHDLSLRCVMGLWHAAIISSAFRECSAVCRRPIKLPHLPPNGSAAHSYSSHQLLCQMSQSIRLSIKCRKSICQEIWKLPSAQSSVLKIPQQSIRWNRFIWTALTFYSCKYSLNFFQLQVKINWNTSFYVASN